MSLTVLTTPGAPSADGPDPTGALLRLDDPAALETARVGAKAAHLARARQAGLPVLPGIVLPTALPDGPGATGRFCAAAGRAWLAACGAVPLVVRSSAPDEDGASSSRAGHYTSVVDVRSWPAFRRAVLAVVASADGAPMAVLVQPYVQARVSGVLFGVDPVSGQAAPVVAAVRGNPGLLVAGEVDGLLRSFGRRGLRTADGTRVRDVHGARASRLARRLRDLERACADLFGAAQDIEWALDGDDRLWLLQSRPVTAVGAGTGTGPLLGPGPVAETLPDPLWPLEADLWVPPLDRGLRGALRAAGLPAPASPVVRVVAHRAVADLRALGAVGAPRRARDRLDPRPRLRRAALAWRTGRLRAAWAPLAADLLRELDGELGRVPPLATLDEPHLLGVLDRAGDALVSAHGYEALAGLLLAPEAAATTAAGAALSVIARDPAADPMRDPVLLALLPPTLSPPAPPAAPSPAAPPAATRATGEEAYGPPPLREALRMRARWLQELQARVVEELASRCVADGRLDAPGTVRELDRAGLAALVAAGPQPGTVVRHDPGRVPAAVPLPSAFRLAADGTPVADPLSMPSGPGLLVGTPAGGGRVEATVRVHGETPAGEGPYALVAPVLSPRLAVELAGLAALVTETGSPLSHMAILAREQGTATVVGAAGTLMALRTGDRVVVDGTALVAVLLADRLARLERTIAASRHAAGRPEFPGHSDFAGRFADVVAAAASAGTVLPWLSVRSLVAPDRTAVFIPLLLGAGVLTAGVAAVVERVARGVARPATARSVLAVLAPLAPPGGLVPVTAHDLIGRPGSWSGVEVR